MNTVTRADKSNITGVILSGGQSRRFGRDKGLHPFKGKPLVMHALDIIRPLCDEVLISTNKPDSYKKFQYPMITDSYPGCGPLAGFHSGLSAASHDTVLFLACDTPNVPVRLYHFLLENMASYEAIMPLHNNGIETLCAVYKRNSLAKITASLEAEKYKILDAHQSMKVRYIPVDEEDFYSADMFHNINFRSDLKD